MVDTVSLVNSPQSPKIVNAFQGRLIALRGLTPFSQRQLASASGASPASLNRWERGIGLPKRDNVELLGRTLERSGVEDATKDLLKALRRAIEGTGLPEWARTLESIEQRARHVMVVAPAMVPGYLQCPALARAIFRAGMPGASADEVDHLVSVRTRVLDELPELNVTAVFLAAAISCLPDGLRQEQCSYLKEWVASGRVEMHLVPEGTSLLVPASPLMKFRLSTGDIAVVSDHADGNVIHEEPQHDRLIGEATWALAASLPVALSMDVLRKLT